MGSYLDSGGEFFSVSSKPGDLKRESFVEYPSFARTQRTAIFDIIPSIRHTLAEMLPLQLRHSFSSKNTQACFISSVSLERIAGKSDRVGFLGK